MLSTAPLSARRWRRQLRGGNRFGSDDGRHQGRHRLRGLARLAAPGEQLLRRQAMPACDFGDTAPGSASLQNPGPVIGTPPPSAYCPVITSKRRTSPSGSSLDTKRFLQIRIVSAGAQPAAKKVLSEHRLRLCGQMGSSNRLMSDAKLLFGEAAVFAGL